MNIKQLVDALTLDEKKELLNELKLRFEKGETLLELYNRILQNGEMSIRMYNILTKTFKEYPDYQHIPVSEGTGQLAKIRNFGSVLMDEFVKLRGY